MSRTIHLFKVEQRTNRTFTWGDVLSLLVIGAILFAGTQLAFNAPEDIRGPRISLTLSALPWYTALSLGRMSIAYALSMLFTLLYGRLAAYNRRAEQILMPLLDVLQSVPILSFLPVILLSLSVLFPQGAAAELASIVLIFTSQAWHLTFAWYQSLTTIPKELREASAIFRLNDWMRFKRLELPSATISLIWNSMMSWAGGWFFLMAAETFTLGQRDFRLPGLGSYLQEAANQGDCRAILWGLGTLILVIVALDQLVWRPLLAWADRFKIETVASAETPSSWFYDALHTSRFLDWIARSVFQPLQESLDRWLLLRFPMREGAGDAPAGRSWLVYPLGIAFGLGLFYGVSRAGEMLFRVSVSQWAEIALGVGATLLRVVLALVLALAWTIPLGVAIGTNRRLASLLQPLVQIIASVPATALFPVFLLLVLRLPGGLNLAAVLLMLMGTQWYLLFNIIAGASAIPQDLKYTTTLLHLNRWQRWRTLVLPGLFPYLVTGAITASGGAWNASIVAEHETFGGQTLETLGIGSQIARATVNGDYPLLLAATLTMVLVVILVNRLVWRGLYRLAEEKYRME